MIDEAGLCTSCSKTITELIRSGPWVQDRIQQCFFKKKEDPTMSNPTIFVYGAESQCKAEAAHRRWPMMHRCTGVGMMMQH